MSLNWNLWVSSIAEEEVATETLPPEGVQADHNIWGAMDDAKRYQARTVQSAIKESQS